MTPTERTSLIAQLTTARNTIWSAMSVEIGLLRRLELDKATSALSLAINDLLEETA